MALTTLHGPHGVTLQMNLMCGAGRSSDVSYTQTRAGASLVQDFSGPVQACRFTRDRRSGLINVRWGTSLSLRLIATLRGTPTVVRDRVTPGCYATSTTRTYGVRGTLAAQIDPRALSAFRALPATLTASTMTIPECALQSDGSESEGEFLFKGPRSSARPPVVSRLTGDRLTGYRGETQLDAAQGTGYLGAVDLTAVVPSHLAPGVTNNITLRLRPSAFAASSSNLRTARIDAASPFSSGSMTYVAHTVCGRSGAATQGVLRGAITIDDPGALRLTITGSGVGNTELDGRHGTPGSCRGPLG